MSANCCCDQFSAPTSGKNKILPDFDWKNEFEKSLFSCNFHELITKWAGNFADSDSLGIFKQQNRVPLRQFRKYDRGVQKGNDGEIRHIKNISLTKNR